VVATTRLAVFDVFDDLPEAELEQLAAVMKETAVEAGTCVITDGDFGYSLYCIEDGVAEVVVDGVPSPPLVRGDTFGEIGLLVTGRRTATVNARTELRLLSLFEHDFQTIRSGVPEAERALRRLGGERLSS